MISNKLIMISLYFKNSSVLLISNTSIFKGLCVVGKHLFKPPVTEEYPEEKPILNNRFRGHHKLFDCKGCGFCKKVCPTNAIIIKKNEEKFRFFINI